MRLLIVTFVLLTLWSCKPKKVDTADIILIKSEVKNFNNQIAITKPPIIFYHLEVSNITSKVLVLNCITYGEVRCENKITLDGLKFSPSQSYVGIGIKDTIILYTELRDKSLTKEKLSSCTNGIKDIEIRVSQCENYTSFIPQYELDKLGGNFVLLEDFDIRKSPNYEVSIE